MELNEVDVEVLDSVFEDEDSVKTESEVLKDEVDEEEVEQEEAYSGEVESPDQRYSMEYVAKELDWDTANLRMFLRDFEDYIHVERTHGNHRRFTRENIEKIRAILQLKKDSGYTNTQLKAILGTDSGQIITGENNLERLEKLLDWNAKKIEQIVGDATKQIQESQAALLEDKKAREDQENILKGVNENSENIAKLTELVEQLVKDNAQKDEEIRALKEQNEKILENTTKKKRFGLF